MIYQDFHYVVRGYHLNDEDFHLNKFTKGFIFKYPEKQNNALY